MPGSSEYPCEGQAGGWLATAMQRIWTQSLRVSEVKVRKGSRED
jgi:hypothetical protein